MLSFRTKKLISCFDGVFVFIIMFEFNRALEITFKPSSKKEIQELEFIPTNLHLQRLRVENLSNDTGKLCECGWC
jgi:hypothetical protein